MKPIDIPLACRLIAAGHTLQSAAEVLGCCRQHLSKHLRAAGVQPAYQSPAGRTGNRYGGVSGRPRRFPVVAASGKRRVAWRLMIDPDIRAAIEREATERNVPLYVVIEERLRGRPTP